MTANVIGVLPTSSPVKYHKVDHYNSLENCEIMMNEKIHLSGCNYIRLKVENNIGI